MPDVLVSGDTSEITDEQARTIRALPRRLPDLLAAGVKECREVLLNGGISGVTEADFKLSSILLFESGEGDLSLLFDTPEEKAAWGMNADFARYIFDHAEINH